MSGFSLASLWETACASAGRCFMSLPDREVSYGDLVSGIRAELARFDAHGLTPGSRVLIVTEDEQQAVTTFIAALLDGHAAVMLAPGTPEKRISAIAETVEPGLMCRDAAEGARGSVRDPRLPSDGEGLAYILFTSGTTQAPSGVAVSRDNLLSQLDTLSRLFGCTAQSRIFNDMVLAHADGLVQGPLLALANGATLIRAGGFSIPRMEEWLGRIDESRATHVITVPTVWSMIERNAARADYFSAPGCRYLISVAAKLETGLWQRLEQRFGKPLYNEYGLTETVVSALYAGPHPEMGPVGTIGRPVDCEAMISNGADGEAEVGKPGELLLRGRNIFTGYWRNPDRTAQSFAPGGWLRTGDLALKREDGAYEILGRIKSIIMMAGFLIRPEEIDEVMLSHPAVAQSVTVGVEHEEFGEIPITAVVLDGAVSEAELTTHARERLEPLKVPKRILPVGEIPRGVSGKPNLAELRRNISSALSPVQPSSAPDDSLADAVLTLASQVFRSDRAALNLESAPGSVPGWDSFSHVTLMLAAETRFGCVLNPASATSVRSLRDFVAIIEKARKSGR
jgi:long-chain acyl-CoA synthetase